MWLRGEGVVVEEGWRRRFWEPLNIRSPHVGCGVSSSEGPRRGNREYQSGQEPHVVVAPATMIAQMGGGCGCLRVASHGNEMGAVDTGA